MNLLIVSQYYYPEQFQINEIAPELVRRGHKVTVLTGVPNYPKGEIFPGYKVEESSEVVEGVKILRMPVYPRKQGKLNLIRNYLSYVYEGSKKVRKLGNYDLVLCYQLSPVTTSIPAISYRKLRSVPLVLYCLDIWPESAKAHVKSPRSPVYYTVRRISKYCYSNCDRIAVTSRPFIDYLRKENGVLSERLSYIPQHAADVYLKMDFSNTGNRMVDFMFAGNLGMGATLDVVVCAVAVLKDIDGFLVHIVGDGSERQNLEAMARELGVSNKIVFHGNQAREDMPEFYKEADALLITLRGDNAVGNTMPGKLQTYMAVGKPILGAINGAASEVIEEAGCGACVAAGDFEGLALLMLDFIRRPEAYSGCGRNAREYFKQNFTLALYCDRVEALMREAVKNR